MKVALLYSGPYRGNAEIVNNHIQTFGLDVDVYVSAFPHYLNDWKESGLNIKEYYITPSVDFKQTDWFKQRNDEPGQSGFWQFWNLSNLINNIPTTYDLYIKNRIDLLFNNEFIPLQPKPYTIHSANESFHSRDWNIDLWINDEFYVGDYNSMSIVGKFVEGFYKTHRHNLNEVGSYVGSNEASLRKWLKESEIYVEKLYNISYIKTYNGLVNTPSGLSQFELEKI